MSFTNATVVKDGEKVFRLMLGDREIGVSKSDCDARFHMHAINDALQDAYMEGITHGEELERRFPHMEGEMGQ
jgi:hypothetical protein